VSDFVLGSDAATAIGRFQPDGPTVYRATNVPGALLRPTREAAMQDARDARQEA